MQNKLPYPRTAIAALTLSAAALVGLALDEGYRERAYIPVPGDVPTIGFGDTHGVKMGDITTPDRALVRLNGHVTNFESELRKCIGDTPMHQREWDAFVRLSINVGPRAVCNSGLIPLLKEGRYEEACAGILQFNKFRGRVLRGLVLRRQREYRMCMGASQ